MSTTKWTILTVAVFLVVILGASSVYVVEEPEFAIVLQFGRVVIIRTEPGFYLKTPLVQSVEFIDRRIKEWDGEPSNLKTVEKRQVTINTWARWRITDPQKYYENVRTESRGQGLLDGNIDSSVKNVVAGQMLMEALRNTDRSLKYREKELEEAEQAKGIKIEVGRDRIVEQILTLARSETEEKYGFVVEGVGIKHFNYVKEVIPKIYERMRSERMRIASLYESEGREFEARIDGEATKDLEEIESVAVKQASIIRGKADAEATKVYADAFGRDPEFYYFLQSLETLKKTVNERMRLVIGTDSPLYKYLKEVR